MSRVCMLTFCSNKCRDAFLDNANPTLVMNKEAYVCPYCGKEMEE